ncbi:uncharacterized protein LOC111620595 [Centruroides sculpturatus]|uniref:uncharacterized protein LOC111620595 n=1 Tax=Centruroides sculpturatus TaxID=218467 RepID=UPI000C6C9707|nr:uncharacterized protein LOC111620595 [Centruroides sculpturatus]
MNWSLQIFLLISACIPRGKSAEITRKSGTVTCYVCRADFSNGFNLTDACFIPRKDSGDLTTCSPNSNFCQADVVRVMGVLLYLERRCAINCGHTCISKSYGATQETCTYCCDNKPDCGLEEDQAKRHH